MSKDKAKGIVPGKHEEGVGVQEDGVENPEPSVRHGLRNVGQLS
jgi:hypothetical protein